MLQTSLQQRLFWNPYCRLLEGTDLLYDDYPFMRKLTIGPDADGCDFRALLLHYIEKYMELEDGMDS